MSFPVERALEQDVVHGVLLAHRTRLLTSQVVDLLLAEGISMPQWKVYRRLCELRKSGRAYHNKYRGAWLWGTYDRIKGGKL